MSLLSPSTSAPLKAIYDVPAPAKLNLFLHITGRRADGYHLIQSVFMLIDWCDTLHLELRRDGNISRSDLSVAGAEDSGILPAEDLTVRAAQALQKATGTSLGVHISLEKRIPSQAGMGGGSSDAASCLLALQRLWGVTLPRVELLALALSLGADVPFFLSGGHAWVEGVGELITPLQLPAASFLVVKPSVGLSTAMIFSSPALKRDSETATIVDFAAYAQPEAGQADNPGSIYGFGRNDLQPVALNLCPQLGQSLDWLKARNLQGRMTGSGSAVFAHLAQGTEDSGIDIGSDIDPMRDWKIRKCSNLKVHPLAGW
jgi:4-diphosphocytidyl-2-C-methyl-D-erythritol kinase